MITTASIACRPWNRRTVWQCKTATGASSSYYYVIDNPCRGDCCVFLASFENNFNANVLGSDWYVKANWMPIWAFGNVDLYQQVKIWHYIEKDEYLGLVFSCQTQDVYFARCIMGLCLTFKQVTHWIMKLYLHKMYINIDTVYFLNFMFQSMVYIEVRTGESYMTRSMCQCRLRDPNCWSVYNDCFDF